jgi:hypothetical protein
MVAPTFPLSAYTDGVHQAYYALGWAAGAATILIWIILCLAIGWGIDRRYAPRVTAWRLRRQHRRSGRV